MAKIIEYREIALDDLVIGRGQARTQDPGKDIDELAESINVQGLLQPIVVCPARESGKLEILTGQRRFLAHKLLRRECITAAVLDERVEESEAKAISITENLIRRRLSGKELTDGIVYLYNIYGSIKAVAETTGISQKIVGRHVRYPRLIDPLKKMVDDGLNIQAAIKAQDAATDENEVTDPERAVILAQEMRPLNDPQIKKFAEESERHPGKPLVEVIEYATSAARISQMIVDVSHDALAAIRRVANEEGTNQSEAASMLIHEALTARGLLEE